MNVQGITPNAPAPQQAQSASAPRAATSSSPTSGTSSPGLLGGSSTDLQQTFLNLLVTELQNQDPTSPVDPTEMVGQMVSLNQLDQLITMNQTLTSMAYGTTPPTDSPASTSSTATPQIASSAPGIASGDTSTPRISGTSVAPQAHSLFTPVDPNSMINLYGSTPISNTSSTTIGGK
jgi:flagellar basal-body rod modification protein FlgD